MDKSQQIQLLLKHAFFQGLSPTEMKALFSAGDIGPTPKPGSLSSRRTLQRIDLRDVRNLSCPFGRSRTSIGHSEGGEVIGEVGLLGRSKRSATVSAQTEAFVWHLSLEVFEGLIKRGDSLVDGLLKGMGDDLCRRFREGVYEAASIMGELAPKTAARLTEGDLEEKLP